MWSASGGPGARRQDRLDAELGGLFGAERLALRRAESEEVVLQAAWHGDQEQFGRPVAVDRVRVWRADREERAAARLQRQVLPGRVEADLAVEQLERLDLLVVDVRRRHGVSQQRALDHAE